jgi:hypothetical protein
LAHQQDVARRVGHRSVHDTFVVVHDAKMPDLRSHLAGYGLVVVMADTEQDAQPGTNLSDHVVVDNHRRSTDPLHHCSHGANVPMTDQAPSAPATP